MARTQDFLRFIVTAGCVLVATPTLAQLPASPTPDTTFVVPAAVGFVNDFAELLSDESEDELERIVLEVRDKSRGEIAIVTLLSLRGRPAQEVAMTIGRTWGVGYAGAPEDPRTNTGVVVLVAPTERQVRVEVGTGAEAFISDEIAESIAKAMARCFGKGAFENGLRVGVTILATIFSEQFNFELTTTRKEPEAC